MADEMKTLTLGSIKERKEAPKRLFAAGRYVLRGNPRAGGVAAVYRGTDMETETPVALKVFRATAETDEVIEESFRREVQALSDLTHNNIVRILDSGLDEETQEHFIAMEWVDQDLTALLSLGAFASWETFHKTVGKGVLEALAFAHSRSTVHRDIKPSNILMTSGGIPKVCDFGISKIRNFLAPGVTLAHFASAPFAPPEMDDGSYSYSRDVFGFAALAVSALTKREIPNHKELLAALETSPLDVPVRNLLRRCLALEDPSVRPQNAIVLLAELERIRPAPPPKAKGTILIGVTKRVESIVSYDTGLRGDAAASFITTDLASAHGEEIANNQAQVNGAGAPQRSLRLFGGRYGYTTVRAQDGSRLTIVDALEHPPSELDRRRSDAHPVSYLFQVSGVPVGASARALDALFEELVQFDADRKQRRAEQREQALYRKWLDLLSAKTELEKHRKVRVQFTRFDVSGNSVRFTLAPGSEAGRFADQDVRVDAGIAGAFSGTVVSTGEDSLVVQPSERGQAGVDALPENGLLEVDTTKSDVALDKQKSAVDAVRYGRSVNPQLGGFIVNPSTVSVPPRVEVDFFQKDLDDDKQEAVRTAVSGPTLMTVQGPPGTGKTTFITEVVLQTLHASPNARILLTSQTHAALDNSLERIVKQRAVPVRAVRIGNEQDDRISATGKDMLLDNQLPAMRREALSLGRSFIERWAASHGLDPKETRKAMALELRAGLKGRLEEVEQKIDELRPMLAEGAREQLEPEERGELDDQLEALTKERDDLMQRLKDSLDDLSKLVDDKNEIKEFSNCSAADLREWAGAFSSDKPQGEQLKKLLSAHAEWETRFARSREFRAALIASKHVVAGTCLGVMAVPGRNDITYDLCIVDEASIATPTEVLVPMSRARRTVLVGDSRQLSPFQDPALDSEGLLERYGLTRDDQKATLFNYLSEELPEELRKPLTTQHRMLPAIGNLVSECFYGGQLRSIDRAPAPHLAGILPKPVTWYSTSRNANRASKKVGTSHHNVVEIEAVLGLLARADFVLRNGRGKGKLISVAVLTGYGEQRKRLKTAIDSRRHDWVSFSDIFVNVVDAFQGREADMLVFSVTRSEAKGLGFLREMERINVGLSRGRELLAIIGDHLYCQDAEGQSNPLRGVIDYIRRNPADCTLEDLTK